MKNIYRLEASYLNTAILEIYTSPTGALGISSIRTSYPARGHGLASMLLDWALRDADAEGVTLHLTINPASDGGLTREQLQACYERRGFRWQEPEACWIRKPRVKEDCDCWRVVE